MPAPARDLIVNLVGKTNQLMGPLQGASAQMSQIGSTLTRTLTPAAAAIGAGMALAGREFNRGVDAIRVGTGKTGDELAEMTDQMRSLAGDSTLARIGMGRLGEIMADVSTDTGATGDQLEDLTRKFGQLERMGVAADVANVARVFGDWSVATDDQSDAMDKLFLAAQASGASVDDLSTRIVQFGAPLRNLGFGFEEATALIASFQKNGVNLETVMGGLRIGIGKLALEGEAVPETFRRIVAEIENAGDASEATRLSIELFGQRAGPDLADAIQNGQFAVEDMLAAIEGGADSINQAAEDTTRLSDKMAALKNRVVGVLGPFGEFGAVAGGAVASLGPLLLGLGQMGPLFTKMKAPMGRATTALGAHRGALLAVGLAIPLAVKAYQSFTAESRRVEAATNDMTAAILAANDVLAGTVDAIRTRTQGDATFARTLADAGLTVEDFAAALRLSDEEWEDFRDSAFEATRETDSSRVAWELARRALDDYRDAARNTDEHLQNLNETGAATTDTINRLNTALAGIPAFSGGGRRRDIGGGVIMHSGGIVPGPPGADVPAILEGGEAVLPRGARLGAAGGPTTLVVNVGTETVFEQVVDMNKTHQEFAVP